MLFFCCLCTASFQVEPTISHDQNLKVHSVSHHHGICSVKVAGTQALLESTHTLSRLLLCCTQVNKENMLVNHAAAPQQGSDPGKRAEGHQLSVTADSFRLDNCLLSAVLAAAEGAQVGYHFSNHHCAIYRICVYNTSANTVARSVQSSKYGEVTCLGGFIYFMFCRWDSHAVCVAGLY